MSKRFIIEEVEDEYSFYNIIRDTLTNEEVGRDGGEPEDQTLNRNWHWVVDALNSLDNEIRGVGQAAGEGTVSKGETHLVMADGQRISLGSDRLIGHDELERLYAIEAAARELLKHVPPDYPWSWGSWARGVEPAVAALRAALGDEP